MQFTWFISFFMRLATNLWSNSSMSYTYFPEFFSYTHTPMSLWCGNFNSFSFVITMNVEKKKGVSRHAWCRHSSNTIWHWHSKLQPPFLTNSGLEKSRPQIQKVWLTFNMSSYFYHLQFNVFMLAHIVCFQVCYHTNCFMSL